jgi:hypothetical protein
MYGDLWNTSDDSMPPSFSTVLSLEMLHVLLDSLPRRAFVLRASVVHSARLISVGGEHLQGRRLYLTTPANSLEELIPLMASQPASTILHYAFRHPRAPDFVVQVLHESPEIIIAPTNTVRFNVLGMRMETYPQHSIGRDGDAARLGLDETELVDVLSWLCFAFLIDPDHVHNK